MCSHTIVQTTVSNEIKESCSSSLPIVIQQQVLTKTTTIVQNMLYRLNTAASATTDSYTVSVTPFLALRQYKHCGQQKQKRGVLKAIFLDEIKIFLQVTNQFCETILANIQKFNLCKFLENFKQFSFIDKYVNGKDI